MSVFVESVDVDAAWEVYYQLADRRHQPGLTRDELEQVIKAALACKHCDGEGEWSQPRPLAGYGSEYMDCPYCKGSGFVSPWVE